MAAWIHSACRSVSRTLSAVAPALVSGIVAAQTPAQMEYDRQQREYWRQQEQQRQEQQRQQQLMQENARRQQEESGRLNAPIGGGAAPSAGPGARPGAAGRGDPGAAATAARAMWEKRPALPADRNPLLGGRWTRPADTRGNSSDPFAALQALARGGLCEVLFGGGMFEFRGDRLVGMDGRTGETELDRVEYRGDAKHVVVLPKTTLKLIEFDVDNPNRISWTGQNCVLVRVAAAPAAGGVATPSRAAVANGGGAGAGGVLALSAGAAGRKLWILKTDAQVALIKGGLQSTPDGSVLQNWIRACQAHAPACGQGARALQPYSVGIATTDASGNARTPPLPPGRYWVLSDAKVENKRLVWNEPVDVSGQGASLTLDRRNATPVD